VRTYFQNFRCEAEPGLSSVCKVDLKTKGQALVAAEGEDNFGNFDKAIKILVHLMFEVVDAVAEIWRFSVVVTGFCL
jgi:hypothetical protein